MMEVERDENFEFAVALSILKLARKRLVIEPDSIRVWVKKIEGLVIFGLTRLKTQVGSGLGHVT